MFKLIKNSFLIVMFALGLASLASAEVSHHTVEQGVESSGQQAGLSHDDVTGKLQPATTGCGEQVTPVDGGLTNDLVRTLDQTSSYGSPSISIFGLSKVCVCCSLGYGDIACCSYNGCCATRCE